MSGLLDALGYVGDVLNKPGRAVRGLLSGNLNEGLAAFNRATEPGALKVLLTMSD